MRIHLKYRQQKQFGLVCSSSSNSLLVGAHAYVPCLQAVSVVDSRTGITLKQFNQGESNVTCMAIFTNLLAVGYADGAIRVWNTTNGSCTLFNGHRNHITSLAFDNLGARLVSGGSDTNIVVWDLVQECGIVRLTGHRDQVTTLEFLEKQGLNHIVSGSKDSLIKIWDLTTQECVETVVSHRGEVWALASAVHNEHLMLVTGGADGQARIWNISVQILLGKYSNAIVEVVPVETKGLNSASPKTATAVTLVGPLDRQSKERIQTIKIHSSGKYIGIQGVDKLVEIMRFKSEAEIKKTISRRMKRNKKQGTEQPIELTIAEKLPVFETIRCNAKVRSFDFAASGPLKVLVALCNNSFEVYQVDTDESTPSSRQLSVVDIGGHRSDVRTVALSSDDELLMTASSEMVKVWSVQSTQCLHSMDAGYALCSAFLPKNRHVVIGTKTGHLEVYDLASSSLIESIQAHDGPIWSLQVKPDKTGLVAGSQDKSVKFFDFRSIIDESYSKITPRISLYHTRTLKLTDDVLAVKVSPDGKLLAVSLLDLTVKIFYTDSLKFFISLYGHKLPVICLDISFDSKLIITGSSDKSIKIWGLDFGDCHKSILAHQDSVMCVQFVWGTYFFFSTGKDGVLTYWDAEKFERLSKLQGHQGSIWALCVGKYGNLVVTASHDKSIRVWEKTDEQFTVQEEREAEMEEMYEKMDVEDERHGGQIGSGAADNETEEQKDGTGKATRATKESKKAGELLCECLQVYLEDRADQDLYELHTSQGKEVAKPTRDLFIVKLEGSDLSPELFVLKVVRGIKSSQLTDALLSLPFSQVKSLIGCVAHWASAQVEHMLCSRILFYLLELHHHEIVATKALQPVLEGIQRDLKNGLTKHRDTVGFNSAGLAYLRRELENESVAFFGDAPIDKEGDRNEKRKRITIV